MEEWKNPGLGAEQVIAFMSYRLRPSFVKGMNTLAESHEST